MRRRQRPLPYYEYTDRHGERRARTRIPLGNGKYREVQLGIFGSPESLAKHRQLQEKWELSPQQGTGSAGPLAVRDLVATFLEYAEQHYRDADGRPTSEFRCYVEGVRPLLRLHGATPARDFGPVALKAVRGVMIEEGWARKTINQHVGRIRRIWKWGVAEQLVPAAVWQALLSLSGLQQGRTKAPDYPDVAPPPIAAVKAAYRKLSPPLRAMVHVQVLTGMRPQDVCRLNGAEIDRPGLVVDGVAIWVFRPRRHKTAWRGHTKAVAIGPRAQRILQPFLAMAGDGYLFRPARAGSKPYDSHSYAHRVRDACRRAKCAHWSPGQLRHAAATAIQHEAGLDAARAVLGHRDAQTTTIYAERDLKQAAAVARRIG